MTQALETLCKWRAVSQMMATMGTQTAFERYVRDVADKHLLLRAETSALVAMLVQKGVFTLTEYRAQLDVEAEALCAMLEQAYPGFRATETGMTLDTKVAADTMRLWNQPTGTGL